ncbi:hypothetical protein BH11ARM2_BH11ARM2_05550 [soil metagenome]
MKVHALLIASAFAATVAAQDDANALLTGQFNTWRQQPDFRLEINGVDQIGTRDDNFQILAFHHTEAGKQQLEIVEKHQVGSTMVETSRIVGDGHWLWRFDTVRREFTAAPYRLQDDLADDHAENAMLTLADVVIKNNASWALRLVREVYGGSVAQYIPWMSPSLRDPSVIDPTYRMGVNPIRRELRWVLNSQDQTQVVAAAYFETGSTRNLAHRTAWTMTFQNGWKADDNPSFAPLTPVQYRTWQPVPWSRLAPASH